MDMDTEKAQIWTFNKSNSEEREENSESDPESGMQAQVWTSEEGEENSESDPESGMQGQALPVAPFDVQKVDTSAVPLTSEEYLRAERVKLPQVVTAVVPKLEPHSRRSNLLDFPIEEVVDFPQKPSEEWQKQRVFNFSTLRYRIECNKEQWAGISFTNFPKSKTDWFEFLFGKKSSNLDCLKQPYLDIVLQLNSGRMDNLIHKIIEWISEDEISVYEGGLWLFALLACIEVPLDLSLVSNLRTFVLECRHKREKLDFSIEENKTELVALNLFICLIGKYFGQRDLAD